MPVKPEKLPRTTLNPVAYDGRPDLPGDSDTKARVLKWIGRIDQNKMTISSPVSCFAQHNEGPALQDSIVLGKNKSTQKSLPPTTT